MRPSETDTPTTPFIIPTLMYHRVAPGVHCKFNVWPDEFERQVRAAAARFTTLTVGEAVDRLRAGREAPSDGLILTFDDAYEDVFLHALPILRKYGVRATVFLPTDYLGQTNAWNPKANYICRHLTWAQAGELAAAGIELGAHSRRHHSLLKYGRQMVEDEVAGSADAVERALGVRPRAFSYPFGAHNALVRGVAAAHYDVAFSVTDGTHDWRIDPFTVNRLFVPNGFPWSQLDGLRAAGVAAPPAFAPPIRAFLFDLDGVLTATAEYHYQAWKRLADEEKLPFSREDNERLRGVSRRDSLMLILNGRECPEETIQEMMGRKNGYYREILGNTPSLGLLPGAESLLHEVRARGLRIAIASSSRNARDVVARLPLGDLVEAVCDGHSARRAKPAPDLFLRAAAEIGIPPRECVVVEDAAAGIEAARAARARCVGIGPHERVGGADAVFPSLKGVHLDDVLKALA